MEHAAEHLPSTQATNTQLQLAVSENVFPMLSPVTCFQKELTTWMLLCFLYNG
jgi:hypothetical protein